MAHLLQPRKVSTDASFNAPTPLPKSLSTTNRRPAMALANPPRALLFDVFGTCVDWRTTVTRELDAQCHVALNDATKSLATRLRIRAGEMSLEDWGRFAQMWRDTYKVFTKTLAANPTQAWKTVDEHHHSSLISLLQQWQLSSLWQPEELRALSLLWHRLDPWSDASVGIRELNKRFWTGSLSNGNLSLLTDLRAHADLAFTHVFSAEQFGSYKPSPRVYLGAVERLGLRPGECAMVAAHLADLWAARQCGLQTVYVERVGEEDWSGEEVERAREQGWVDLWVEAGKQGFVTVAEMLGGQVEVPRRRSMSASVLGL